MNNESFVKEENFQDEMSEFPQRITNSNSKINNPPKLEEIEVGHDESFGYFEIIDEKERTFTDTVKFIPRVSNVKRMIQKTKIDQDSPMEVVPKFRLSNSPFINQDRNGDSSEQDDKNNLSNDGKVIMNVMESLMREENEKENAQKIMPAEIKQQLASKKHSFVLSDVEKLNSQESHQKPHEQEEKKQEYQSNEYQIKEKKHILQEQNNLIISQVTSWEQFALQQLQQQMDQYPAPQQPDEECIYSLAKDAYSYEEEEISSEVMMTRVQQFAPWKKVEPDPRSEEAFKEGGQQCKDKNLVTTLRNIGKEIVKEIGRQILSGSFNLTQVSFPIRAMVPRTALEKCLASTCLFPLYLNRAASITDQLQRFKLVICATLGNFYINCTFLKPLNPILGESCSGHYNDGTLLYAEQISHHPPISYSYVIGPDNSYQFYGNYHYQSSAGLNSLVIKNQGSRHVIFKDGQHIQYSFAKQAYSGSFWSTMKLESDGSVEFKDVENQISTVIKFNTVKQKPTDYFQGEIKIGEEVKSTFIGSYMGFIDFDDKRYWDIHNVRPYQAVIDVSVLGSDHNRRADKIYLTRGHVKEAQKSQVKLQELQRNDAKLRQENEQLRQKQKEKELKDQKKKQK